MQPSLGELLDAHPPRGPVLDLGCGTGDVALALAERRLEVLGIDIVEAAINGARVKAEAAAPDVRTRLAFQVADALYPSRLERRFGSVVDSGFFHLFGAEARDRLVDEVAAVLDPGGRYYLLAFAIDFDLPNTPLRVTETELRERFAPHRGWGVVDIREAQFLSRMAPPVAAVAACVERLPASRARTPAGPQP